MEKLLTDEIFNPEPCDIRLFATNIARLICEEMTGIEGHGEQDTYDDRVFEEKQKAKEILKALE